MSGLSAGGAAGGGGGSSSQQTSHEEGAGQGGPGHKKGFGFLHRLHSVLARVGGAKAPASREAPRLRETHPGWGGAASRAAGAGGHLHQLLQPSDSSSHVADSRVLANALQQLDKSNDVVMRVKVLDELSVLVKTHKFADLPALWAQVADLLEPQHHPMARDAVLNFVDALCTADNFNRLGILRLNLFRLIQDAHGVLARQQQLHTLNFLTQDCHKCAPFERDVCRLLTVWLWEAAQEASGACVPANKTPLQALTDQLRLTGNLMKISSVGLLIQQKEKVMND